MKKITTLTILISSLIFLFAKAEEKQCQKLYPIKEMANYTFGLFLIDRLGYTIEDKNNLMYEITSWYGGDYNRVWLETEGTHNLSGNGGEIENLDILYGKWIRPFWDGRIGITYIGKYGNGNNINRGGLVLSLKGLAPYMFETDFNIRFLTTGEMLADLELEYSLLLTQRLILQPKISTLYSSKNIEKMEIGSGLNNLGISLRLIYEIKREFAPYIEITNTYYFGNSKDFFKRETGKSKESNIYLGVRLWF